MRSLPLPLLLSLGWHKKFGQVNLLVPSAPLPPNCLLLVYGSIRMPSGRLKSLKSLGLRCDYVSISLLAVSVSISLFA